MKSIVRKKTNKGNTVLVIDKEEYIQGVKIVNSDSFKFIPLNIPPEDYINYVANVEKKFRKLLITYMAIIKSVKKSLEFLKICPVGSIPGILYSNPKVHKPVVDNMPNFRPILSTINPPGYNLAKFLTYILEPLTHSEFIIKDSISFAKEI